MAQAMRNTGKDRNALASIGENIGHRRLSHNGLLSRYVARFDPDADRCLRALTEPLVIQLLTEEADNGCCPK